MDSATGTPLAPALRAAHAALQERLRQLAPELCEELLPWMEARAGRGKPPETYFTHLLAFPLVALPWWLEESLRGVDEALQADLMFSSMAGYYLIRLIDDVMDHSPNAAVHLLPAIGILHAEFQGRYIDRFPSGDPFWEHFYTAWAESHQAAVLDSRLTDIDAVSFRQISARKVAAARIPLIAAARHHGLTEPPAPWPMLFEELCAWHQLHNDVFDWQKDSVARARTWFLCEADRRKLPGEPVMSWIAREGFELGFGWLSDGLKRLQALAAECGSPGLTRYFEQRASLLDHFAGEVRPSLPALAALGLLAAAGAEPR